MIVLFRNSIMAASPSFDRTFDSWSHLRLLCVEPGVPVATFIAPRDKVSFGTQSNITQSRTSPNAYLAWRPPPSPLPIAILHMYKWWAVNGMIEHERLHILCSLKNFDLKTSFLSLKCHWILNLFFRFRSKSSIEHHTTTTANGAMCRRC